MFGRFLESPEGCQIVFVDNPCSRRHRCWRILMDFKNRLQRAIERGQQTRKAKGRELAEQAMSEEELRNLHSKCRLELSDHIENCLRKLSDHFLGFHFETIVSEDGWGAKVSRDDIEVGAGRQRENYYSRLQMVIRPFTSTHILELAAKGTIRNKEVFNRSHFQFLSQTDVDSLSELIDLWVLEYAEVYSARM